MKRFEVAVPGDYATLHDALVALNLKRIRTGCSGEIRITSGHIVEKGITFRDGNYAWLRIKAEDGCVPVKVSGDLIACFGATGPRISCLFDMGRQGGNGIRLQDGSQLCIDAGAGVINAGNIGLRMYSSCSVVARGSHFSGAAKHGIWMEQCCTGDFDGADVSEVGGTGLHVNHASRATARNLLACGTGQEGVYARHASSITLWKARFERCGTYDIRVEAASLVDAWGASYSLEKVNVVVNLISTSGQIVDRRKPAYEECGYWKPQLFSIGGERVSTEETPGRWWRSGFTVSLSCDALLKAACNVDDYPLSLKGMPFCPERTLLSGSFLVYESFKGSGLEDRAPSNVAVYIDQSGDVLIYQCRGPRKDACIKALDDAEEGQRLSMLVEFRARRKNTKQMVFPGGEKL